MEKAKLIPIRFPIDLLIELDKSVGKRYRSKFIIDATQKELHRAKQRKAIQKASGILNQQDYPKFKTSQEISNWVIKLREESEARRKNLFE